GVGHVALSGLVLAEQPRVALDASNGAALLAEADRAGAGGGRDHQRQCQRNEKPRLHECLPGCVFVLTTRDYFYHMCGTRIVIWITVVCAGTIRGAAAWAAKSDAQAFSIRIAGGHSETVPLPQKCLERFNRRRFRHAAPPAPTRD